MKIKETLQNYNNTKDLVLWKDFFFWNWLISRMINERERGEGDRNRWGTEQMESKCGIVIKCWK